MFTSFGEVVSRFDEVLQWPPKLRNMRNTRRESIHSYVDFTINFATVNKFETFGRTPFTSHLCNIRRITGGLPQGCRTKEKR